MTHQQTFWDWNSRNRAPSGTSSDRTEVRANRTSGGLSTPGLESSDTEKHTEARQLHQMLEGHLGTVDLVITNNKRRMVSSKRENGRLLVRLHRMFLRGERETIESVAEFLGGDKEAKSEVQTFIENNRHTIEFQPERDRLDTQGTHFDLSRLIERVRDYFPVADSVDHLLITWGRDSRGEKTIQLGSFDFDQNLIRIHPALDQEWIPQFFVEYVIYHEMIHAIVPPEQGNANGPRDVHSDKFEQLERQFPRYEEAMEWESKHVRQLLEN